MRLSLKNTYTYLFFLGIFFIPFNSYDGFSFLGEYKRDAAVLFFLGSILLFSVESLFKGKIHIPVRNLYFQILMLFILLLIVSIVINLFTVFSNYFKQTSGFNRFFRQFLALFIMLLLFLVSYNIIIKYSVKQLFFKLRKAFLCSFIIVAFYGFFECLVVYFKISVLKDFVLLFNYFPFIDVYLDYTFGRISSVSYEPPFLAIYLITISAWMFSYMITDKGFLKYLPSVLLILLTFFSGSRTALIVITFQLLMFLWVVFSVSKKFRIILQRFMLVLSIFFVVLIIFKGSKVITAIEQKIETLNFKEDLSKNISNKSRFGIQYSSILIFLENPIIGVGFGQQAYHAIDKYPKWATENNYEFKEHYLNTKEKSFPPGFNLYTRLLAEIGAVGVIVFLTFILLLIYQCKRNIGYKQDAQKVLSIVLFISFTGFAINWLQFDSFRLYGFWICLSLFIYNQNNEQNAFINSSL